MTTFLAAALICLLFPLLFLLWLTETKQEKARRWRKSGHTYAAIAERLQVSQTTARRLCIN